MPVVQPQAWDKAYNPWIPRLAEDFWNKLPAHIRSDLRSNYQTMSDAPNPGLPIGAADDIVAGGIKGAVAIPAMLANPKTRTYLKNMMGGIDLAEAVKAVRNQQEALPFAFTQWIKDRLPRGGLFFSPFGHKFGYDEMAEGAAEGGPHRVEWLQKLKNPLVIKRDETGFLAEHVLRTLLGSQSVKQGNKYVSVPNEEGKNILNAIHQITRRTVPELSPEADEIYRKYLTHNYIEPKQLESSLAARDPKTALGEAIASELARKAGYDSIISTRPKTVISASQKMANEATIRKLSEQFNKFSTLIKPKGTSSYGDASAWGYGDTPAAEKFLARIERKRGKEIKEKLQTVARNTAINWNIRNIVKPDSKAKVQGVTSALIEKVAKRGAKTELLPTQVMMIEKQFLKDMREKGKQYLNPPRSTLSSYGQSIVNLFKKGQMQSDALPEVIKFNLEQGTIAPEEIQLIQQAIQ